MDYLLRPEVGFYFFYTYSIVFIVFSVIRHQRNRKSGKFGTSPANRVGSKQFSGNFESGKEEVLSCRNDLLERINKYVAASSVKSGNVSSSDKQQQRLLSADHKDTRRNNIIGPSTINGEQQPRMISETRGEKTRKDLREIRKQQRLMKIKYDLNKENLRYYCFYKRITDKYYQTLRKC